MVRHKLIKRIDDDSTLADVFNKIVNYPTAEDCVFFWRDFINYEVGA